MASINNSLITETEEQDETLKDSNEGNTSNASVTSSTTPSYIEPPQQDYHSYMADWNREMPIESDEDYAKRRRRAKNAALFGAISDGISSLANLYATSRYAPSAYNANTPTLTGKVLERYDKMEDERKKDKAAWAAGAQRARQLDEANAKDNRNYRMQFQQYLDNKARQDEAAAREAEKHGWEREANEYNISRRPVAEAMDEAKLKKAQSDADNAGRIAEATIRSINAKTAASNRSNRVSGSEPLVFLGKQYNNSKNWEKDVRKVCKALGVADDYDDITYTGPNGNYVDKRRRKKKSIEDLAAEAELAYNENREWAEEQLKNIMGRSGSMFQAK